MKPRATIITIAACACLLAAPALAAPIAAQPVEGPALLQNVRWHGGWWGPALGFAAGAAIGSALAGPGYAYAYEPDYYYGYGSAPDATAYCLRRFRSYDPASGTYLGYDRLRHPCP